jgi:fructose-1,6-bisphosphatase I
MSSHEGAHAHAILDVIKRCCIEISTLIRQGDSENNSKDMHHQNISGDEQLKLDLISNEILKEHLLECEHVRAIGSEEEDSIIPSENEHARYLVCFDPLDGSSNIDVNITVGTIFAIYRYSSSGILTNGRDIVMAGYCLYGGSTQLIVSDIFSGSTKMYSLYTRGTTEDFVLIEPNLRIPEQGKIYAINESNRHRYLDKRLNAFVEWLIKQNRTARWVGSLVADAHRTLIKGGFFAYPGNTDHPCGKLRLLYEVYPFAFIFDISGGCSSDGRVSNLLDLPFPASEIHMKTSTYLSSPYEMELLNKIVL